MKIAQINYEFHADSCGDNETASAFAAWAKTELERRYPNAAISVTSNERTSGVEPAPIIVTDCEDVLDDAAAQDAVREELRRLWDDWLPTLNDAQRDRVEGAI